MSVTKLGILLPTYKASLSQVLALHAGGEILLLSQAVHLALPGVKVAAVLWVLRTLQSQSHTIWNISWNIS